MACAPIITGDEFLERTLTHIDCQAQLIGSYGYQALGQSGSTASLLVASLLTVFVALFGIRLLFGPHPAARDVVFDVLKIGVVLTLAFSWPAFRTVIYDVTLKSPGEIASVVQISSGNGSAQSFTERLQKADNAIISLTAMGSGRNAGELIDNQSSGSTFQATAIDDDTGYGSARVLYLASVIGTLGLLRIGAGLLLALAPLAAAMLFFSQSRGLFGGWLKGLVFTIVGSIGISIVLSVKLAIIQPWLADALNVRGLGYATPAAPTELISIMLAFLFVQIAMLWLLSKVVFYRGWLTLPNIPTTHAISESQTSDFRTQQSTQAAPVLRAERISHSIESSIRRERMIAGQRQLVPSNATPTNSRAVEVHQATAPCLGSTHRRSSHRVSRAARLRDQQS
ncbi:type IV secretion system protein [uncultured Erythrobacter sp.]|uniref:type IV secretion system protein n=1 Tax=uncultured Erythrobacter sp. TaxID=263913 RepID=UPI002608BDD9|nr:type IV secretion system protein [uncultured Erythrobacter sp.]